MPKRKRPRKKDQAHDAIFKTFFSDAIIARNYLLHYTPAGIHQQIDFSIFQKSDTAFVSGRFGVSFCDIVYETRLNNGQAARLLFLFEHKSYMPSVPIHLQLLDYFLQIWEDDLKNKRPLSVVVPIVVYHGEHEWDQKPLNDYFPGIPVSWQTFVPNFHYLLTDLSQTSQQLILQKQDSELLRNLFLALKFARNEALVRENWKKILTFGVRISQDNREKILFQSLTLYLVKLYHMPHSEVKNLSKDLPDTEYSWVDAIPEIFVEKWKKAFKREGMKAGREEGRQEGIQKGREEQIRIFTLKTIQKFPHWSDEEVAVFAEVSIEFVQNLRKQTTNGK
jgi:predicted transposase YdaD